jgi:hypothetical protein
MSKIRVGLQSALEPRRFTVCAHPSCGESAEWDLRFTVGGLTAHVVTCEAHAYAAVGTLCAIES